VIRVPLSTPRGSLNLLWAPVAVGVREFEEDDGSPLIGIARRDGFVVSLPAPAMVHEEASEYTSPHKDAAPRKR